MGQKDKPVTLQKSSLGHVETIEVDPTAYSVTFRISHELADTLEDTQRWADARAEALRVEIERSTYQMAIEATPEHDRTDEEQAWLAGRYLELDRRREAANRYETLRSMQLRQQARDICERGDVDAVYNLLKELEDCDDRI